MEIFTQALAGQADIFAAEGWVHIPGGVSDGFIRAVLSAANGASPDSLPPTSKGGNKSHILFQFPAEVNYADDFVLPLSRLCGLNPARFTLSQRHVMQYLADAKNMPKLHKDRYASSVSVGIPLSVPSSSRLVLYPYDGTEVNSFMTTDLRRSLSPEQLPEARCGQWREVEIADKPGDLIVFRGSRIWHSRRNPQGAMHLYLMLNDLLLDPLGEDPWAALNRQRACALFKLEQADRDLAVITPGRQLDTISAHHHRSGAATYTAHVWPEATIFLSAAEEKLVRFLDRGLPYACLHTLVQPSGFASQGQLEAALQRLITGGVLDVQ